MTLKKPQYSTEQGYKNLIKLQTQYEKVVEQNKQLQAELREKTAECEELKSKLNNEKTANESEIEIINQACLDLQEELKESLSKCEELKIKLMQKDEMNAFFNTPIEGWSNDPCKICESKNEYPLYAQALDEIENYCKEVLSDVLHYSQGAVIAAKKVQAIIKKQRKAKNEN